MRSRRWGSRSFAKTKETRMSESAESKIQRLEAELQRCKDVLEVLFDQSPDGICTATNDFRLEFNAAGKAISGPDETNTLNRDEWAEGVGIFYPDGKTPY